MAALGRLRSRQRALATLVGLAPVVALHTVAPGVVHGWPDMGSVALLDGPAAIAVFGIAYAIRRTRVMWFAMFVSVVGATGVMAMVATEDDGSLALIWWAAAYLAIFLMAFAGEAIYNSWKAAPQRPKEHSKTS